MVAIASNNSREALDAATWSFVASSTATNRATVAPT
jgi:hypothetical protein